MKFEKKIQKKLKAITKDYSKELNFVVQNLNKNKLKDKNSDSDIDDIVIRVDLRKKQAAKLTKKYREMYRLSESEENSLNDILKYCFVYWIVQDGDEEVYLGRYGSLIKDYENMVFSTLIDQQFNISYSDVRKEALFSLSKKLEIKKANKLAVSEYFGDVIDFEQDEIEDAIFIKVFRLEYDHFLNSFRMMDCLD